MSAMFRSRLLAAVLCGALVGFAPARAEQAQALSPEQLATCAGLVKALRSEAPRLTGLSHSYDQRRDFINNRSAALQAERKTIDPDDLSRGLDFRQRMQKHTAETIEFNQQVETLKRDVTAINLSRDRYDRECARRPYRRADLEALPADDAEAMRAGLSGVQVPYLDPAATAFD